MEIPAGIPPGAKETVESIEHVSVNPRGPTRILFLMVGLGLGGAERVVAEIASGLDPQRFTVEVYSLKGPGPIGEAMSLTGIRVTAPGGWRRILSLCSLWGRIRLGDFDVVHSHLIWANIVAVILAKGIPVIWHEHDSSDWMGAFHRFLYRRFIGRSTHVVAVSRAVGDWVQAAYPFVARRMSVIPNPLPSAFRFSNPKGVRGQVPPRTMIIGFVGRLEEPKKGLSVLLEAMARVNRICPEAVCHIVGEGPARDRLLQQRKELKLDNVVQFLGPTSDTAPFYGSCDIFVFPSLWEGFGLVLLEAMAAELPIVATRVGGIPEIVRDGQTGILVPPGEPEPLARMLCRLIKNPEERWAMGKAARESVEKFKGEVVISQFEQLYENLSK